MSNTTATRHTTGRRNPLTLVEHALAKNVRAVAITLHSAMLILPDQFPVAFLGLESRGKATWCFFF